MWGDDELWAGWCVPDAERAWRLFLPLVGPGGAARPWPAGAEELDGELWWPDLAEYPGSGGPALDLEPASGMVEPGTLASLECALTAVTGPEASWRHVQDEPGPARRDARGSFAALARAWTTGFAGRAWCLTTPASVAAPSYSDSLVVAGPARLGQELIRRGLQIASVEPSTGHRMHVT